MRLRLMVASGLLVILLLSSSCINISGAVSGFQNQLNSIVQPYTFNYADWELNTLAGLAKYSFTEPRAKSPINSETVLEYFSYVQQINNLKDSMKAFQGGVLQGNSSQYEEQIRTTDAEKSAIQAAAEQTIAMQISETLTSMGVYNPLGNLFRVLFPPVSFKLEKPLYMLVVSPRDSIQKMDSVTVRQDISPTEIENLENSVDGLSVSSLVVEIGGLGATYPTFVIENSDLRWTIETAVHEWVHQYLAFKPLGFGYVLNLLGVKVNTSIPTINETVASMVGKELGDIVYYRYYGNDEVRVSVPVRAPEQGAFDFNKEMREIRTTVDKLLSQGQIEQAENFMNEKQKFLASNGYYIRKLNQAYFAFYGSYADSPTSVDPIGQKLRILREHSIDIVDFLKMASGLRNPGDLDKAISPFGVGHG